MNNIIDGKAISEEVLANLKKKVANFEEKPKLVAILVGNDSASKLYIKMKGRVCRKIGIDFEKIEFNYHAISSTQNKKTLTNQANLTLQNEIIEKIKLLNSDKSVTGIMVQLPLPENLDESKILDSISSKKDVDGLTSANLGKVLQGSKNGFYPATVLGIITLLEKYKVELEGKNIVIIGQSNEVGKPLSVYFGSKTVNSTVTTCNKFTRNLNYFTKNADIIISSAGVPNLITEKMVKLGVVIIDVGTNKIPDKNRKSGYKLVGDVDFEQISKKAKLITPSPGGVGPMTIASLMSNLIKAKQLY